MVTLCASLFIAECVCLMCNGILVSMLLIVLLTVLLVILLNVLPAIVGCVAYVAEHTVHPVDLFVACDAADCVAYLAECIEYHVVNCFVCHLS